MFTLVQGRDAQSIKVSSMDGDVEVRVSGDIAGLPDAILSREEAHDALVEAKDKALDFLAAVDADIEATAA